MRFDEGKLIRRDVVFDEDRLIARHGREPLHPHLQVAGVQVQPNGDRLQDGVADLSLRVQQQGRERWIVIDDGTAFAIQQPAARRQDRNLLHPVLLGHAGVVIRVQNLQTPQPKNQQQKNAQYDVLRHRQPN